MTAKSDDSERPAWPVARHAGRPTFQAVEQREMGTKRARGHERSSADDDNFVRVFDLLGAGSIPRPHWRRAMLLSHAVDPPHLGRNGGFFRDLMRMP